MYRSKTIGPEDGSNYGGRLFSQPVSYVVRRGRSVVTGSEETVGSVCQSDHPRSFETLVRCLSEPEIGWLDNTRDGDTVPCKRHGVTCSSIRGI